MGRKPIGDAAMSSADRVRKHREQLEAGRRATWHPSQSRDESRFKDWLKRAWPEEAAAWAGIELQEDVAKPKPNGSTPPAPKKRIRIPNVRKYMLDFYTPWLQVLGLEPSRKLTREDVTAAFKQKVKAVHPDAGGNNAAFRQVQRAKEVSLEFVDVKDGKLTGRDYGAARRKEAAARGVW